MRILQLHCDYVSYKPKQKALKSVPDLSEEEKQGGRLENVVVVFSSFEVGDNDSVLKQAVQAVQKNFEEVKAENLLVYPYAHLSNNLAPPSEAVSLLNKFLDLVKQFAPNAKKSPFGYYKEFELKCKGHPLSELSKTINAQSLEKAAENLGAKKEVIQKTPREYAFLVNAGKEKKALHKKEENHALRNSSALLLSMAVKKVFPEARLGEYGLSEDGFYADFDVNKSFEPKDFVEIEKEMHALAKSSVSERTLKKQDAIIEFSNRKETYAVELLKEAPDNAVVSVYESTGFMSLNYGNALKDFSKAKAFKILKLGGAYWKGSAGNKQLQRLTAVVFESEKELASYLHLLEEAEKRDHRKLGKELELFEIHEEGVGFPFFLPNGMIIRNEVEAFLKNELQKRDYKEIKTPIILEEGLWRKSGHWDHYHKNMYFTEIDGKMHAVKPMNCPGAILIFKNRRRSYRELPLRLSEFGLVHRHELSGVVSGLVRVRAFTQDDSHIFATEAHLESEVKNLIDFAKHVYNKFGFSFDVELSTRPEDYMGSLDVWNKAEELLKKTLDESKLNYSINEGDGAFYGPKIDFKIKDSLGRQWQLGTIQADFQMPERFELEYDGSDGKKHRPIMIHRTILGSFERFFGILIEHYAGAFPTWLSPIQVTVIPLTKEQNDYGRKIYVLLKENNVRVEIDDSDVMFQSKIHSAQSKKSAFMLVLGRNEEERKCVSVRKRSGEVEQGVETKTFLKNILNEIQEKTA